MAPFVILGLVMLVYVTLWYVIALIYRRNDIADIAWGPGITLLASVGTFLGNSDGWVIGSVLALWLWALRLAWHIGKRVMSHPEEDKRYQAFRTGWGKYQALGSFLQVFLLQGILMIVLALPVILLAHTEVRHISAWIFVPIVLWIIGFLSETIGDYQLKKFLAHKPAPQAIMNTGIWRYTRHPNYFGEVAMWWSVWVYVMILIPWSWSTAIITLLSPMTITYLLLYVSGIPMLEKKWEGNPAYRHYQQTTSALIPWFPKTYDQEAKK